MSTRRTSAKKTSLPKVNPGLVWFDIPADNIKRAKKFYTALFGWKINPMPGMPDYQHVATGGHDKSPDGGMIQRKHPQQPITVYMSVASADKSSAKVKKLGGAICMPKTAVPGMGYFVICEDSEGNSFALWEPNEKAK